jgi:hypothetical protein
MERVRELAQQAVTIDEGWESGSAQYRYEDGDVREECLRRYDELRFDYALEAWEVASAFAASVATALRARDSSSGA